MLIALHKPSRRSLRLLALIAVGSVIVVARQGSTETLEDASHKTPIEQAAKVERAVKEAEVASYDEVAETMPELVEWAEGKLYKDRPSLWPPYQDTFIAMVFYSNWAIDDLTLPERLQQQFPQIDVTRPAQCAADPSMSCWQVNYLERDKHVLDWLINQDAGEIANMQEMFREPAG